MSVSNESSEYHFSILFDHFINFSLNRALAFIRKQRIINSSLEISHKIKRNLYPDEELLRKIYAPIFPVFLATDNNHPLRYTLLPFFYSIHFIPSRSLPYIEIIECPIWTSSLFTHDHLELSSLEAKFASIGRILIATNKKIHEKNLSQEMLFIRSNIINDIIQKIQFDLAYIHFSCLYKGITKNNEINIYLDACTEAEKLIPWEKQPIRYIPIIQNTKILHLIEMKCWSFAKKPTN